MSKVRHYECLIVTKRYKLKVQVFSNSEKDVSDLAKLKAANLLKRVYRYPARLDDLDVIEIRDRGETSVQADSFMPALIPSGK